jgi:acyl dehydratase
MGHAGIWDHLRSMKYGLAFDEVEVGRRFRHEPGRTISEFDDTLFSLMTMNQHPVHIDEHYAQATQHGQRLVVGLLVVSIVIGLTQSDIAGQSLEVLEYEDIRHLAPVFHGDTLYAESVIAGKEALDSARGVVTVESRGLNQRGESVLSLRQRFIAPRSSAHE